MRSSRLLAVGVLLGMVRAATGNIAGLHRPARRVGVGDAVVAHELTRPLRGAPLSFLLSRFDGFVGWLVLAWTAVLAVCRCGVTTRTRRTCTVTQALSRERKRGFSVFAIAAAVSSAALAQTRPCAAVRANPVTHQVQRAHDHQAVALAMQELLDLRQPALVAGRHQRAITAPGRRGIRARGGWRAWRRRRGARR